MKERKHKRKLNHVLILTSDAADANVKQFRIRAWLVEVIVIMLCILIGGVIGYMIFVIGARIRRQHDHKKKTKNYRRR